MAADGNVHLAKEVDHFVAGNSEFARQIMYSKLAQPISSLRPSGIGVRLSARIPFANPLSTIPITAVASRPATEPSSVAGGPATTMIPRARSSGSTLSKLFSKRRRRNSLYNCPGAASDLLTPTIAPRIPRHQAEEPTCLGLPPIIRFFPTDRVSSPRFPTSLPSATGRHRGVPPSDSISTPASTSAGVVRPPSPVRLLVGVISFMTPSAVRSSDDSRMAGRPRARSMISPLL